jgi:hypothetical protein
MMETEIGADHQPGVTASYTEEGGSREPLLYQVPAAVPLENGMPRGE